MAGKKFPNRVEQAFPDFYRPVIPSLMKFRFDVSKTLSH